jgi:hypothetical protein
VVRQRVIEEALNLAHHSARAREQSFDITLKRELDSTLRPIDCTGGRDGRLLNLISALGIEQKSKRLFDS